jgi:hypothetical protein
MTCSSSRKIFFVEYSNPYANLIFFIGIHNVCGYSARSNSMLLLLTVDGF